MSLQFDTSGTAGDIFNNTVGQILAGLDQNAAQNVQRQEEGQRDLLQGSQEINDLLMTQPQQGAVPEEEPMEDYNMPVQQGTPQTPAQPQSGGLNIKLANYGYDSDTSPDTNSNILKIGHSNNPLKDGVSAALTKSLATRYGLKTGDMFEVTTADGKTMQRRYDDTVPNFYRGKPLPETVDLYETKGSNSFGGRVTGLKKL